MRAVGRALAPLALLGALAAGGCAGARVTVSADRARYPVSLSAEVRDKSGRLFDQHSLTRVGTFNDHRAPGGIVYSALTIPSTYDISDAVNQQVASSCGEAVINLSISISDACTVLNMFPFLNAVPIWPGCVPLSVSGEIVRRGEASCSVPTAP